MAGVGATATAIQTNAADMTYDMMPGLGDTSASAVSFAVWEQQSLPGSGCDGTHECPVFIVVDKESRLRVAISDRSAEFNTSATFHHGTSGGNATTLVSALTGGAVALTKNMTGLDCTDASDVGGLIAPKPSGTAEAPLQWELIEPLVLTATPPPPSTSLPVGTGGLSEIVKHGDSSSVQSHLAFILASGAAQEGAEFESVAAAFMNAMLSDEQNCLFVTCFTTRAHLTGGMTGLRPALQALVDLNRTEELIEVLAQDTWPSLGFQYKFGATALWESWGMLPSGHDALEDSAAVCGPGSLSGGWLVLFATFYYTGLGGIQQAQGGVGYRELVLRPMVPWRAQAEGLSRLRAERETPLGTIVSSWRRIGANEIEYNATVPPLASATILVPTLHLGSVVITEGATTVWEDGTFVRAVPGLASAAPAYLSSGAVAFRASSGEYRFTTRGEPGRWTCATASTNACAEPTLVCDAKCPVADGTAVVQCEAGERIVAIEHASFAAPLAPWVRPSCEPRGMAAATAAAPLRCAAGSAQYVVERACLGKQRCAVQAAEAAFDPAGQTQCRLMSGSRQLVIHAVCAK